ncbi:hypothetical protein BpHYR1_031736 [Brachionus plicatilis]|uniref:Uncharacterized protein n=1 Tax=Brachionus plicatilis TaxID=10195 RepID=A0A3M7SFF2_BRAPC|nr:hypothetical protein BpHYR1_031736 [Brachionus plicatilis]
MWFKRNPQNYSKIVHQKLNILEFNSNENPEKTKQQENETFIELNLKEFKSFAVSNSKRRRLLGDFEEALNTQLQKNGFNCYFKCNHNWFKSENSRKRNLPIWSGLYKCIHEECQQSIITEIAEIENEKISDRIMGLERKLTALKLKAEGVSNNLGISTNSEFRGFVHNLSIDPFGFLLMSDIQLKIWIQAKCSNPIWYFDATGSVHKDIVSQKKPLLYSIDRFLK